MTETTTPETQTIPQQPVQPAAGERPERGGERGGDRVVVGERQ